MSWVITPSFTQWTPALITTAMWLDAADASTVTTVSSAVSQWNDKSGNGRNASQSTSGNRPVYESAAQNGLSAVRFTSASSQFMTAGTTSTWNFLHNGTSSSVFIVSRIRSTGEDPNTNHTLLDTGGAAAVETGWALLYDDRVSVSRNNAVASNIRSGTPFGPALTINQNIIIPGAYTILGTLLDADNATAADRLTVRLNGGTPFGGNTETTAPTTGNSTYALQLGRVGFGGGSVYLTGDICEVLILNTHPTATNRQRIEGYLAHKWGLTANLPADHPYKINPPAP
jgi:hypothetical protein